MEEKITISEVTIGITNTGSAFVESGLATGVSQLIQQVQEIYLADEIPWIIGYSGGKDSTATLQIVWMAVESLKPEQRNKKVYVVTNDTLVENPVVVAWVKKSHDRIRQAAQINDLPIEPHLVTPEISKTFWVNLIGRGYPAPNRRFRWCTERMKIHPTTSFIREIVSASGEAIIVLGARKAESADRAARIEKYDAKAIRENLSPHNDLPSALVYKPIVDWSNDDVWLFLTQYENPWGHKNKDLLTMYRSATADEECPLVIDTSTSSCGNSRFGCWTCTVVAKDKSMSAMIHNDAEREWMLPLLELRDELAEAGKESRDFRRMSGRVSLFNGEYVPGPYTQEARKHWLRRVLEVQKWVRQNGPEEVRDIELISFPELCEIRQIWIEDKHEHEDFLPQIYEEVFEESFPDGHFNDNFPFGSEALEILKEETSTPLQYELLRELLSVEHSYRTQIKRTGIKEAIAGAFDRSGYETEQEAIVQMKALTLGRDAAAGGNRSNLDSLIDEVEAGVITNEKT